MTPPAPPPYAELQATTHFSFLRGSSAPEELLATASLMGHRVLGVCDRNSVAGLVRTMLKAGEVSDQHSPIRPVLGCRLDLVSGASLLVWPEDAAAWSRLTRLLTLGKGRAQPQEGEKGRCFLHWDDLAVSGAADGLVAALVTGDGEPTQDDLRWTADVFGADRGHVCLTHQRRPGDAARLAGIAAAADAHGLRPLATGDVLYHHPDRRRLHDVVTAIRHGCTVDELGLRRERSADRHLQPPEAMARRFADHPRALTAGLAIAERCRFDLRQLRYQYPSEAVMNGRSPQEALERLARAALAQRFGGAPPEAYTEKLDHELNMVRDAGYAPYFLTVNSIVGFARSQKILCQGRGSAANSVICFVLGITSIDPIQHQLLFERFISADRKEPPDIDVDFEHERREEVIQWIYEHYGRGHAALTAVVSRYRARGAVREVGKALGLSEDVTAALAGQVWGWSAEGVAERHADALNLDKADLRLALTLELARELIGTPRHLSQHPGGFVLAEAPLADLVPLEPAAMENRQVIEWEKDDIEALKFMKVDVLGLGMLGCMRRAFDLLAAHKGVAMGLDDEVLQQDCPKTFAMIQKADTLGVFQIESRAQMAMLPRMKPKVFYDIVIQVAIVRPGPIQGDMVHPYLKRRDGLEAVTYPNEALRGVLEKTKGVPLFQEQAMKVAIVGAGFSPARADGLRRAMATFKYTQGVAEFRDELIAGMEGNGIARDFAERMVKQIEGFGSYGFPESHAMSFARIAYASSWMKCHHPDIFCAALLNAQPMGFYAPAQIVRDAREHGVEVLPVCVQASDWDTAVLPPAGDGELHPLRLGMRVVAGLAAKHAEKILEARAAGGPFGSVAEMWRRSGVPAAALERLARADAFQALGLDRRRALWAVKGLGERALPLADGNEVAEEQPDLFPLSEGREVVEDYRATQLSLRAHPLTFLRPELARRGIVRCKELASMRDGQRMEVAGVILVRQKPGSAKGVLFVTVEDETGVANAILWPDRFEAQRTIVMSAAMLGIVGRVQRGAGGVVHVITDQVVDYTDLLRRVGDLGELPRFTSPGDGATHPGSPDRGDPGYKGQKNGDTGWTKGRADYHRPFRGGLDPEDALRQRSRDFR